MLDLAIGNIRKQRTRTILTVFGIFIGITAIVALGSFAEGINTMVNRELAGIAGNIIVSEAGSGGVTSGFSGSIVTQEQVDAMATVPGVDSVVPVLIYIERSSGFGPGSSWFAIGINIKNLDLVIGKNIAMDEGSSYDASEHDVTIVGSSIAESMNIKVGDFFTIKNHDFLVTGVMEKTDNQNIDSGIIVPLEDMQTLLGKEGEYQMAYVIPENPQLSEVVADDIMSQDETLSALTAKDLAKQVSSIIDNVRIFTFGVGAIAAFVGGLGVMNTMIMAVIERKRELGVMKAMGATKRMLLVQILTESSIISLIGGVAGLSVGWLISLAFGVFTGGTINGVVTPALAAGSLVFALALGVFGGLYPAWKAAKLDPVDALRG